MTPARNSSGVSRRPPRARRRRGVLVGVLALAVSIGVFPQSASAAALGSWASWSELTGGSGAWASSASFAVPGLGPITVASTSAGGAVGVVTGSTRWLGPATPPGALFGSSAGKPYLNLANSTGGNASVTTYTFAQPAPGGTWAIVLGDVDMETLSVSATGPTGNALTAAELGWAGAFNYCGGAGSPSCSGTDVPVRSEAGGAVTLTGGGINTDGAAGWLRPTAALSTVTITAQRLPTVSGIQIHQVWFAAFSRDLTGTVTGPGGAGVAGATLTLRDAGGATLGTTTSGSAGTYAMSGLMAVGATLTITPPTGLLVSGSATRPIDLTGADAVQDVVLRAPVAVTATGTVVDTTGTPVPGATITLTQGTTTVSATSATNGTWTSPTLSPGTWTLTATAPTGWVLVTAPTSLNVAATDEGPAATTPVTLRARVAVTATGTVVDTTGTPVPGASITLTQGATTLSTTSATDGTWTSPTLSPGTWTLTVTAPAGWVLVAAPTSLSVTTADEGPVTATTPVTLRARVAVTATGTVVDTTGAPVPGATITLTDGTTTVTTTTAADGTWTSPALTPGTWTLTVVVPTGWTLLSAPAAVVVAASDEGAASVPPTVTEAAATDPDPTTPTTPTEPDPVDPVPAATLAVTGASPAPLAVLAAALLAVGTALTAGSRLVLAPHGRHLRSRRRPWLGR